jgi:glycosyltransferase involved in cell wall biosynthesis
VWLYTIHNRQHIDREMLAHNAPDVPLVTFESKADWFIEKATSVCRRLHIDFNVREAIVVRHLKQFIKDNQIEVAHAHMFVSDYILSLAKDADTNFTRIATMHGTHEGFLYNYHNKTGVIVSDYICKLNKCLSSLNGIVYGTDRNLTFLTDPAIDQKVASRILTKRIYNGFESPLTKTSITRELLGIADDAFVFMLLARGIPAKGWPLAIAAFKQLNRPNTHLVLVGDSDYVQALKRENEHVAGVHFAGRQLNVTDWISIADVGMLPTTFGESVPAVIVEFLSQQKPIIVTDVAECANMITTPEGPAGFVINLPKDAEGFIDENYTIDPAILAGFMARYFDNPALLHEQAALANAAFEQFSMTNCVAAHIDFYQTAVQQNKSLAHI